MPEAGRGAGVSVNSDNKNASNSNGGKKRKVAGRPGGGSGTITGEGTKPVGKGSSSGSSSASAVQQIQAATGMSAEAAAAYLAAAAASSSTTTRSGGGGRGPTTSSVPEVKISFGPSRPPSHGSGGSKGDNYSGVTIGLTTRRSADGNSPPITYTSTFGENDLEDLKERMASVATGSSSSSMGGGSGSFSNKQGMPCTQAEMKALMGMFVEIMGMSMKSGGGKGESGDSDGKNVGSNGPGFSFPTNSSDGGPASASFAATGSFNTSSGTSIPMTSEQMASLFSDGETWEALRRTYAAAGKSTGAAPPSDYNYSYDNEELFDNEDDDDDDDDFDDSQDGEPNRELTLEEVEFLLQRRKQEADATNLSRQFSAGDWESLEQGASTEYQMQVEDRERKAAKNREKKQRRKAKQKEEAAQKAAEAAQKKREKAILSWRSRVVSSCQSNETAKLESLLQESPLRRLPEEEGAYEKLYSKAQLTTHLEFLLPNTIAKNRSHVERGAESRMRLADFVLDMELPLAFKSMRSGRTALHVACFFGDVRFIRLLFDKIEVYNPADGRMDLPPDYLDMTCEESGWSPLHYAALSGSSEVLELLLEKGPNLRKITDATHTWRDSDGLGITARELVECVISGKQDKEIETHGIALLDVTNSFLNQNQERRLFLRGLERVQQRLSKIEKNGYTPPPKIEDVSQPESSQNDSSTIPVEGTTSQSKKRQKKKKKKKKGEKETQIDKPIAEGVQGDESRNNPVPAEVEKVDPLVLSLQGMGFSDSQIADAVKACGGTHRATADDLVTWILTQETGEDNQFNEPAAATTPSQVEQKNEVRWEQVSKDVDSEITDLTFEKEQKEQLAKEQQEEAARRLAAKREEARRRNREWNNREQARQEQEAKAKVAQKAFAAVQQSALAAPSSDVLRVGLPNVGAVDKPYSVPIPQPSQAISSSSLGSHVQHMQTGTAKPPVTTTASKWEQPAMPPQVPLKHLHQAGQVSARSVSAPPSVINPVAPSLQQPSQTAFVSFSQNNDDDRTVSSFGSNRGLSVSSKEFVPTSFTSNSVAPVPPVPPPGFMNAHSSGSSLTMPPRPPVATVPEHSSSVSFQDDNLSQGEIRATAKAFVPSGYTPHSTSPIPPPQQEDFGLSGSSLLSQTQTLSHSQQPQSTRLPTGSLSQASNTPSAGVSSLLGANFSGGLDTVPSATPVSEDSTTAGTSLAGFVSTASGSEDLPMSIALGGLGESSIGDSIQGSSIGGSNLLGAISRGSSVGGSSLWRGAPRDDVPSLESSLQASFFGEGGVTNNGGQPLQTKDENKNLSWHPATSSLTGTGGSQSGGSIW